MESKRKKKNCFSFFTLNMTKIKVFGVWCVFFNKETYRHTEKKNNRQTKRATRERQRQTGTKR